MASNTYVYFGIRGEFDPGDLARKIGITPTKSAAKHSRDPEREIPRSPRGDRFAVTRKFEEPACLILIDSFDSNGEFVGHSSMRMGVPNSDDLEAVDLAEPYVLCAVFQVRNC